MRTMVSGAAMTILAILALGSLPDGAVPGVGGAGSAVGPYATSLAEHQATEAVPAPTYDRGEEVPIAGFTYRVDAVGLHDLTTDLNWRCAAHERAAVKKDGARAIAIRYAVRNDAPVAAAPPVSAKVFDTAGGEGATLHCNANPYREEHGIDYLPDTLPPGQWVEDVMLFAIQGDAADGAALRLHHTTREPDPRDPRGRRKMDVLHEQVVIDLRTPEEGPHLDPAKR